MDELDDLIWGSSGINKTQTQKNNSTPLNLLREGNNPILSSTSKTSKNSTPSSGSNDSNFLNTKSNFTPSSNYFVSSTQSTSHSTSLKTTSTITNNTEAFDDLISFNKKHTDLSLIEQLKKREQDQRRKEEEDDQRYREHYDQSHFWDSLERRSQSNVKNIKNEISSSNWNGTNQVTNSQKTPDLLDDLLFSSSSNKT